MTRAHLLLICVTLAQLAACGGSGPVVADRYYSLVLAADDGNAHTDADASARLIVGPIQLPDYLRGRSIAMQVGQNQIESANHHFWAEPLEDAIAKVLTRDIARHGNGIAVEREAGRFTGDGGCRLRLEFDAFHPTNRSQAVASGRYWISNDDSNHRQAFNISRTLTIDGYAHAVDVLRGTLEALAQQIAGDIEPGFCRASQTSD